MMHNPDAQVQPKQVLLAQNTACNAAWKFRITLKPDHQSKHGLHIYQALIAKRQTVT